MIVRRLLRLLGSGLLLFGAGTAVLQPLTCADVAAEALASAADACAEMDDDQICYGHPSVELTTSEAGVTFAAPGDRATFSAASAITLSAYDEVTADWGIAYVRTAESDGVAIELILLGDAALTQDEDGALSLELSTDSPCADAPNGFIVRAAGGSDPVSIRVNGETLPVGATPLLVTMEAGALRIGLLPGSITLDETSDAAAEADASLFDGGWTLNQGTAARIDTYASSSAAPLIPTAGTWTHDSYAAHLAGPCDGEFTGAERRPPPEARTQAFDFNDGMSLEAFLLQLMGRLPPGTTFDNPAPNLYTGLGTVGGNPIHVALTVVSEREMIYTMVFTQVRCLVQYTDWWVLAE